MPYITFIFGKPALSKFRLDKLHTIHNSTKLTSNEVYIVLSNELILNDTADKLELLLNGKIINKIELNPQNIMVAPRLGTVSPWSSMATEIAQRCNLKSILRIEKTIHYQSNTELEPIYTNICDKMTQSIISSNTTIEQIFAHNIGNTYKEINILTHGKMELESANQIMGLALSSNEIDYLFDNYTKINRNISDVELMMFAQANSEHCRHKIFNAKFIINGQEQSNTLFSMIKDTYKNAPQNILVAYDDNSSVIKGAIIDNFSPNFKTKEYTFSPKQTHILMKVETHNHPTAIEPFAGAATGCGGEIRDEGATGCGSKPKAGLCGFSVSYLNLNNTQQKSSYGKPSHIKSALDIMIHGPIGAANFNNEFGRPNLCGYFRSFEQMVDGVTYGYHKPIMIAGGYGNIDDNHIKKREVIDGALIIHIGGPSFLIGLGGGSASSMAGGDNLEILDFNSVQRSNPEIERRSQEVINSCCSLGIDNPILSIHDVGAGGLSNAVPELVNAFAKGGKFELRSIPSYDSSLSPLEIWCNESQERYVLAIVPDSLKIFNEICQRENCPYAIIGTATTSKQLILNDRKYQNCPIDMSTEILLGNPPRTLKDVTYINKKIPTTLDSNKLELREAIYRVISHPSVASKSFLITIGDRSVGGYTIRDQMVGKWQVPIADFAITSLGYGSKSGEIMAIGERSPLAILNPSASGRMAIAESLTNIAGAQIKDINDIKLSANWMASCGSSNQDAILYATVEAVSSLSKELNIAIPVGKDSLSMKIKWQEQNITKEVISPVSVVITAFATTMNVQAHHTPELKKVKNSSVVLLRLNKKARLGGSILQECYSSIGGETPDVDNGVLLKNLFNQIQELNPLILAYHDKSDGGLIITLSEMVFASRLGLTLELFQNELNDFLFNEEVGVVIQIYNANLAKIKDKITTYNLDLVNLGTINLNNDDLLIYNNNQLVLSETRLKLQQAWNNISHQIQQLRDNPECANSELLMLENNNTGLFAKINFDITTIQAPQLHLTKPKVAILREQGVNGHMEMAVAFVKAGFNAIDVHINDILSGIVKLSDFVGMVACGGFSYGDVLNAGQGWAKSILFNSQLKDQFSHFFARNDTFSLGVCNGCQMMAHLKSIIPGSISFPTFTKNLSEQFEARVTMVGITKSPSILLQEMEGSQLPIIVSHGEGFAHFDKQIQLDNSNIIMQYLDSSGKVTQDYPLNPNGSPQGISGVCNNNGRVTLMMPHPERTIWTQQMSWHESWGEMSPWFKLFLNARRFVS